MKKIICLLFLFIFSLVFISCDENNPVIDDPVNKDIYYEVKFIIDEKEDIKKVKENTKVTKPVDPEKDGFEFIGWFTDDTLYDFESLVTKDIIIIAKFNELDPILEISVLDNKLNMGYSTQINAKFYNTEEVSLKYKVDQKGIVIISSKGLVTALRPGVVKITAYTESLVSNEIEIEVLDEIINEEDKIDLKGYTIKHNIHQFDKEYLLNSKYEEHQELYECILKIEEKYNCIFSTYGTDDYSKMDVVHTFNNLLDNYHELSELYQICQKKYPTFFSDDHSSYVYDPQGVYYIGTSRIFDQNQGFYYDLEIIKELGLADPLTLYLEGKWTYSNFIAWCEEAKYKLENNPIIDKFGNAISVMCGDIAILYNGMMNTIGKRIIDPFNKEINFDCEESNQIRSIINELTNQEILSNDIHESLLVTDFDYIDAYFKFGSLADKYSGYNKIYNPSLVPFPYPDSYNLDDLYYSSSYSNKIYFNDSEFINYPENIEFEDIFNVFIELLVDYQLIKDNHKKFYNAAADDIDERIVDYMASIPYDKYMYDFFDNEFMQSRVVVKDFLDNGKIDNSLNDLNEFLEIYNMEYK